MQPSIVSERAMRAANAALRACAKSSRASTAGIPVEVISDPNMKPVNHRASAW
jgi:hypothetical protein